MNVERTTNATGTKPVPVKPSVSENTRFSRYFVCAAHAFRSDAVPAAASKRTVDQVGGG